MWLQATSHLINKSNKSKLLFIFDLNDAVDLCCYMLHHPEMYSECGVQFDAIYSSNLFDHLSPPALVLNALPLLKPNGTLFTATFKAVGASCGEYLEKMFGFTPELFPVFLGIHCVGQDGDYSSAVNTEPYPNLFQSISPRHIFSWRNIKSQPNIFDDVGESQLAIKSLLNLCTNSSLCGLLEIGSVESFLCVLQQFLMRLHSPSSYHLLHSLSKEIRNTQDLKPHLVQLQTQSLLHGIHIHITLTEDDCPICKGEGVEGHVQQCVVSLDCYSIGSHMNMYEAPTFTVYLGCHSGDLAIFTSFAVNSCGSRLELLFFLPKHCLSYYHHLTVDLFKSALGECVFSGSIDSLQSSSVKFLFLKRLTQPFTDKMQESVNPLGNIVKHIGDGCSFETVISMSETCVTALKVSKLNVKCGLNDLQLSCRSLKSMVVYPYAIDESRAHIKVSKKTRSICVTVQRAGSVFYKEKSTYYIDPSNKITLPKFSCHPDAMQIYCSMQLYFNTPEHPVFNAKRSFTELFKNALNGEKYFTLSFPSQQFTGAPNIFTLVYVHDVRFSTAFSSPALDVSYCFLDTKPIFLLSELAALHKSLGFIKNNIIVDDAEYKFLKVIFNYFSNITRCALSTDRHTVTLPVQEHGLWTHFDHAILFPLFPNPANPKAKELMYRMKMMSTVGELSKERIDRGIPSFVWFFRLFSGASPQKHPSTNPDQRKEHHPTDTSLNSGVNACGRCKRPATISCSCQSVSYCSEACKNIEWPEHEKNCKQQAGSNKTSLSASNMKGRYEGNSDRVSTKCARCKKPATIKCSCDSVTYCSKACQTLEWPEHSEQRKLSTNSHQKSKLHNNSCDTTGKAQAHNNESKKKETTFTTTKCSNCNKTKSSLKYCMCKNAIYCSVACQRLHWPQHKSICTVLLK